MKSAIKHMNIKSQTILNKSSRYVNSFEESSNTKGSVSDQSGLPSEALDITSRQRPDLLVALVLLFFCDVVLKSVRLHFTKRPSEGDNDMI